MNAPRCDFIPTLPGRDLPAPVQVRGGSEAGGTYRHLHSILHGAYIQQDCNLYKRCSENLKALTFRKHIRQLASSFNTEVLSVVNVSDFIRSSSKEGNSVENKTSLVTL